MRLLLALLVVAAMVGGGIVATTALADGDRVGEATVTRPEAEPARLKGEWPAPQRADSRPVAPQPGEPPAPEPAPPEGEVSGPVHPTSFTVADAVVSEVALFSSPGVPVADGQVLNNPTWEGLDVVFLVKDRQPGWFHVQVSSRPNEMHAWVRADDVSLRTVPNRVTVSLSTRRATVYHGDTELLSTTVAIGTSSTPTPLGSYFVDGIVPLDGGGPYGAGQVSISAFSEVYDTFGGGVGQLALHGTNAPGLLGQAVSNGCIRMDNASITQVMDLAPTGTPVEIVA